MIRVGIVGENYYNDSTALKNLLQRQDRYQYKVEFVPLLRGAQGDKLKSFGAKRLLELDISKESKKGAIKFIIFFHDLDGFPSDKDKINDYRDWFHSIRLHNDLDVLFLVIWESEALLLADIEVVNKFYKVKINYGNKNPLFEKEPKEYLQRQTQKKYVQSDCIELFTLMDFDTVYKNHKGEISFQSFIDELDEKLS